MQATVLNVDINFVNVINAKITLCHYYFCMLKPLAYKLYLIDYQKIFGEVQVIYFLIKFI